MDKKIWTAQEAYAAVTHYFELLKDVAVSKPDVNYTRDMTEAEAMAMSAKEQKWRNDKRRAKLLLTAAQQIFEERVQHDLKEALSVVLVKYAGKSMGPKTSEKFFRDLKEELGKTIPGVRYVCFGRYHYSLTVTFEYTCDRDAEVSSYFENGSPSITDMDNRVDVSTQIHGCEPQMYPSNLEEWVEEWLATDERHKKEFEEFKARIMRENSLVNIGYARLPYLDSLKGCDM